MADRNTTPYYQLFEQLKHQFCQWIFVERHTLVAVTEKFNQLFEEMFEVTGFRMRAEYKNWVTRKRKWDKEWRIGETKGLSGDPGPDTEILKELNDLPLWYVGDQKIRHPATGQILFNLPSLQVRYETRASRNGKSKKALSPSKKPSQTLHSSRSEPALLAYNTPISNTMTSSTYPDARPSEAQDTERGFCSMGEKGHGLHIQPSTPMGNFQDYGNGYWAVDPSLARPNALHPYNEPGYTLEKYVGLSAAQAPYSHRIPEEMMLEGESSNDDLQGFFLQAVP